jgi:hypothetical protein
VADSTRADRPASTRSGPGRLLVAVYAVFAISALGRSSAQLLTKADDAPVPYALSALAALVYVAATLGLAEAVPRSREVAWVAVGVELVGVLAVGTVSVVRPEWFPDATVWSSFGQGYGYLPAVLPVVGILWLLRSRPSPAPGARRSAA